MVDTRSCRHGCDHIALREALEYSDSVCLPESKRIDIGCLHVSAQWSETGMLVGVDSGKNEPVDRGIGTFANISLTIKRQPAASQVVSRESNVVWELKARSW